MESFHQLVGADAENILWWQMAVRAVIVFFFLALLIRVGGVRAFGRWTPLDMVLAFLLGSTLSRGLTGNSPLLATLAAATVLMFLHLLLAVLSVRWEVVGYLVKGRVIKLMENGAPLHRNMLRAGVTERELREHLRSKMNTDDLEQVDDAYLERGGNVSFVKR